MAERGSDGSEEACVAPTACETCDGPRVLVCRDAVFAAYCVACEGKPSLRPDPSFGESPTSGGRGQAKEDAVRGIAEEASGGLGWFLPAAVVALLAGSAIFSALGVRSKEPATVGAQARGSLPLVAEASASAGVATAPNLSQAVDAGHRTPEATEPTAAPPVEKPPFTTAAPAAERPIDDAPPSLSELLVRASAAKRAGDANKARRLFDRALVVSPGNAEAFAGLGDLARARGDLAAALRHFERSLGTSPSYAPALLGLGDTLWDVGDHAAAQRHYRQLVAQSSSVVERAKTRALAVKPAGSAETPASPPLDPTTSP